MNQNLEALAPYPFQRLAALLADVTPSADRRPISLAIGEPQHPPARVACEAMLAALEDGVSHYPGTRGERALREAIAGWLQRRFNLPADALDPDRHILPAAGTREALFAFAQTVVTGGPEATVAMPNPGYQIYEGAALLAGARPVYLPCLPATGYLADLDALTPGAWDHVQLLYLCSPGNPTGAVADRGYLKQALALAERHDFIIAADECYSEIYPDESAPPPGLLDVAHANGHTGFERCVVFHSLSKRSNLPGLRSGFVAGDARILEAFLQYRTYHGATLGSHVQAASTAAWGDEAHVRENRARYRAKFDAVLPILQEFCNVSRPAGAFYLWPAMRADDEQLTRTALAKANLRVVPGRYLAREVDGSNPGAGRLRLSLVVDTDTCIEAIHRLRHICQLG